MAVLITGRDLFVASSSNTNDYFVRGVSYTGMACSSEFNCIVAEGNKLHVTPIVITHELGHSMGLTHDDVIEGTDTV